MLPNRAGKFKANVIRAGVGPVGQSKLLAVGMTFRCTHECQGDEWVSVAGEGLEISQNFFLQKKDGTLNEFQIKTFQEVFGWDGRDPFTLEGLGAVEHPCQITLDWDEYDGKTRLIVRWINHHEDDRAGFGLPSADEATKKKIMGDLGAKFRALAGGTPVKPPATKAAAPAKPAAGPKPPAAPKPDPAPTVDELWAKFCENRSDMADAEREEAWWALVEQTSGQRTTELTDDQRRALAEAVEKAPF